MKERSSTPTVFVALAALALAACGDNGGGSSSSGGETGGSSSTGGDDATTGSTSAQGTDADTTSGDGGSEATGDTGGTGTTGGAGPGDPGLPWTRSWGGDRDEAFAQIVYTDTGYMYAAGSSRPSGGGDADMLVARLDETGEVVWARRWDAGGDDVASGIAVVAGTLMIVGTTNAGSGGMTDGVIASFSVDGELGWGGDWGGAEDDQFVAVLPDGNRGVWALGHTSSFATTDSDIVTLRFELDGNLDTSRQWAPFPINEATGGALEPDGDVIVLGRGANQGIPALGLIIRLDPQGRLKNAGVISNFYESALTHATAAEDGTVFVLDHYTDPDIGESVLGVHRLDDVLVTQWFTYLSNADRSWNSTPRGVLLTSDDRLLLLGAITKAGEAAPLLLELDQANGDVVLAQSWASTTNAGTLSSLVETPSGTLLMGGHAANNAGVWADDVPAVITGLGYDAMQVMAPNSTITGRGESLTGILTDAAGTMDSGGGGRDGLAMKLDAPSP